MQIINGIHEENNKYLEQDFKEIQDMYTNQEKYNRKLPSKHEIMIFEKPFLKNTPISS